MNLHFNQDLIEQLLSLYLIEEDSRTKQELKEDIDSIMGSRIPLLLFSQKPMLPAPKKDEINGDIQIGRVIQGEKTLHSFGLTTEEINQHMIIAARSGSGKTTLIMWLINQFISNDIPFLIFDFKLDYRHLVRKHPQLVVLKWSDLRLNLLEPPPSVSFVEWKQQVISIFGHVEGIWKGSTQYLLETIDQAYKENNGKVKISDAYSIIKNSRETTRKFQDYSSVVETRLYGILSTLGETIDNYTTMLDIEELLKRPVVIEMEGLDRNSANLIVLWFFYWIYAYRRAKGVRGKLLHALILDEAKRIFTASEMYSQTTSEFSGIPPADLICDEIRDFGEAIIASDQEPGKVSDSLKANTFTKITSYLGNGKDLDNISEAMDLNQEERDALSNLERGEWLVKLAGRYTKPFLIRSEDVRLEKNVTDKEIADLMKLAISELISEDSNDTKKTKLKLELPRVSIEAWALLTDVNYHPFKSITTRYKSLNLSVRKAAEAKRELVQKLLIREQEIKLGKRRPTKFLLPTNIGLKLLEEQNHSTSLWKIIGRQGLLHQLYVVLIAYAYKRLGQKAFIEKTLPNKRRVDVLVCKDRKTAIEVELGPFTLENELRALEHVDELIILVKDRSALDELRYQLQRLSKAEKNCVKTFQTDDFLQNLRPNYNVNHNGNNSFDWNKLGDRPIS
jgi:hypothetical protein